MKLIVGHSRVRQLESLCLCNEEFQFLCKGGATFQSLGQELKGFFDRASRSNPEVVYVFLGSNDIDKVAGTEEVNVVIHNCMKFHEELRSLCPHRNNLCSCGG